MWAIMGPLISSHLETYANKEMVEVGYMKLLFDAIFFVCM